MFMRVCRSNCVRSVYTLLHVLWLWCQQLQGKSEGVCGFSACVWYVCVDKHGPFLHLTASAGLFPGCRCCSEITSCQLPHCVCIRGLQPFPVHRQEETGWASRAGAVTQGLELWKEDTMTLEMEERPTDTQTSEHIWFVGVHVIIFKH